MDARVQLLASFVLVDIWYIVSLDLQYPGLTRATTHTPVLVISCGPSQDGPHEGSVTLSHDML